MVLLRQLSWGWRIGDGLSTGLGPQGWQLARGPTPLLRGLHLPGRITKTYLRGVGILRGKEEAARPL